MDDFRRANTGGLRNEVPLTEEQKAEAVGYAMFLGMPRDKINIVEHCFTGYAQNWDILTIGTDVLPLGKRTKNPNSNISLKGTIAHEIVGHRDAKCGGFTQTDGLLEEAQASIRAARFAPDLSRIERIDLLKDGIYRLNKRNIRIRSVKNKLHINER